METFLFGIIQIILTCGTDVSVTGYGLHILARISLKLDDCTVFSPCFKFIPQACFFQDQKFCLISELFSYRLKNLEVRPQI